MPRWQQNVHKFSVALMCLLFAGFGWFNLRFLSSAQAAQARKGVLFMTAWIIVLAAFFIGMSMWFWRRIIIEFSYDGSALRLRTLGRPEMQTRDRSEISEVDEWRGRGGPQGYKLKFRDGQKMYLHYSVTNAVAAAERIRSDIRR
jgi:hypothetical protein